MFEFIGNLVDTIVNAITGGGDDDPDPDDPCNATECVEARIELEAARKAFVSLCIWAKILGQIVSIASLIASTPLGILLLLAFLVILLSIAGLGFLAALILAFFAIYGLSWLIFLAFFSVYTRAVVTLAERRIGLETAIQQAELNCPQQCHDDMDLSSAECELPNVTPPPPPGSTPAPPPDQPPPGG